MLVVNVAPTIARDRFGLGWRPELAGELLLARSRIDLLEVVADDWFDAPKERLRALQLLSTQFALVLHGVGLGLASVEPVEEARLARFARLLARVDAEGWSEHLAFVRGGGVELGHLVAPPRRDSIVAGLARNFERAARVVGSPPLLENVATLVDPPGSDRDEAIFVAQALAATGAGLVLDLHNLHANATNLRFDALAWLDVVPMESVVQVHLAGGRAVARGGVTRVLDDHRHDVPDPVYALLESVGERCPQALTVLLERDGDYPSLGSLLGQLDLARAALERGRARRSLVRTKALETAPDRMPTVVPDRRGERRILSAESDLNAVLARAYVDPAARAELVRRGAAACGASNCPLDEIGLELTAESLARKRARLAGSGA